MNAEWTPRLEAIAEIRAIAAACDDDAYPHSDSAEVDSRAALHELGVADEEIAAAEAGPATLDAAAPAPSTRRTHRWTPRPASSLASS